MSKEKAEDYIKRSKWKRELQAIRRQLGRAVEDGAEAQLPSNPIEFCQKILGFTPTSYQTRLLKTVREGRKRILLRWARQSGKSWILAAIIIWFCALNPNRLALIVAPGLRQSMILSDRIHRFIYTISPENHRRIILKHLRTLTRFKNGSQIVALPNSENLLRGYTAHLVVCDEAAFFHNDETIFQNILTPMMATTNGTIIVSSTPWGKKTMFYQFNQDPDWELIHIDWRKPIEEGIYDPDFAKEVEKIRDTRPQVFKMEYMAEFIEDIDTWLPQDLLAKVCAEDLTYTPFDARAKGRFYAGVDLAERVDYSAVAVMRKTENSLDLVHIHRPQLGTSLASVIGYVKTLHDRWNRIHAVYVDKTKHGDYIIQDFHDAGVPEAEGMTFTQNSKQEMGQLLKQRMQEGVFRMPYDRSVLDELNVEKYELTKTGKISFSHPEGTHDDRFWATALAVYAAERTPPPPSRPIARTL